MQELLKEKQKAEEDADAASKGTVIKVLMGEVQVNNLKKLNNRGVRIFIYFGLCVQIRQTVLSRFCYCE